MKRASRVLPALALSLASLAPLGSAATAETVTEPRSGATFESKRGDLALLGVGLRTRTMLKVKVYAIGLYAADSALPGLRAKAGSPDVYKDLVWGDFPKELQLRLVRDVTADQMRGAIREALEAQGADKTRSEAFIGYFSDIKSGQDYVLRWAPGGTLETIAMGQPRPPIVDKTFAAAVFAIWLGDKPVQEDIKKDLLSRLK
jgi:hypothetical protein